MDETQQIRIAAGKQLLSGVTNFNVNVLRYVAVGNADNLLIGYAMDRGLAMQPNELHELIESQLVDFDSAGSDEALSELLSQIELSRKAD